MTTVTPYKLRKQQKYCLNKPFLRKHTVRLNVFIKESSNITFNKKYTNIEKSSLDWHIWDWVNCTKKIPSVYVKNCYSERILILDNLCLRIINKNPILNILTYIRELQSFLQSPPFNLTSKVIINKNNSVILIIE